MTYYFETHVDVRKFCEGLDGDAIVMVEFDTQYGENKLFTGSPHEVIGFVLPTDTVIKIKEFK